MGESPEYLTLNEAANRIGVQYEWMRRAANAGKIPVYYRGHNKRTRWVRASDLDKLYQKAD